MRISPKRLIPILFLVSLPVYAQTFPDAIANYRTGRNLEERNLINEANIFYDAAVRICSDEISKNTATKDTYTILTWTLQRQKKYADVVTWGERGLRIFADEYRVVETMGEAFFYLNDFNQSLRYMQRYTNSVPRGERTSVAYFFIGEIYRFRSQFHHADIAYSAAVQMEPGLALWWYRLGTVREAAEDFLQAIKAYEQAIKINPNYQEANDGLVRSRRRAGV